MNLSRRSFFALALPTALALGAARGFGIQSQQDPPKRVPPPPPPFQRNQQQEENPPTPDPHTVLKSYQKDIKKDVQRLLELAQELKKEVDKTDSVEVLNLSMIRKAEEIEKLARQIKTMARG